MIKHEVGLDRAKKLFTLRHTCSSSSISLQQLSNTTYGRNGTEEMNEYDIQCECALEYCSL